MLPKFQEGDIVSIGSHIKLSAIYWFMQKEYRVILNNLIGKPAGIKMVDDKGENSPNIIRYWYHLDIFPEFFLIPEAWLIEEFLK